MQRVRIDDVDRRMGPASVARPLTDALGTTDLSLRYYELAPGESFAFGYHTHYDQEEVFYVEAGTVTFETAEGDVEVGAAEAIRFGPGEFQRGVNEGDERVRALGLGAPRDTADLEMVRRCDDCGERTPNAVERAAGGDAVVTRCERCGAETGRFD